jgi:EmrB/QacA subfamily drug resistance transporter
MATPLAPLSGDLPADLPASLPTPRPATPVDPADPDMRRWLPWVVATALFMEQLDTTIVNTAIPSMATSLGTTPLALRAVVSCYIVALATTIPLAGWMADRWGTRRVFRAALAVFTLSSLACGLAPNAELLIAARIPQGMAAAMMMPVGRIAIVQSTPKADLLRTMNFVILPALLGPLLGPTVGGLIVATASWREVFFINVPVGLLAMVLASRHMPQHTAAQPRPLDVSGLALFGGGVALLSWALEMVGQPDWLASHVVVAVTLSAALLASYGWHARHVAQPLLTGALFRLRTFRLSVIGGFLTRLGVGGMPFLLPLLYQLGLGRPAWQSGLLMMPTAAAAMVMKPLSARLLARFGYREVLRTNTGLVAITIGAYSLVGPGTPVPIILMLSLLMGLGNSLQFSSINTLAYADVGERDASMAATLASTGQQLSLSVGLAVGAMAAAFFLHGAPETNPTHLLPALHHAFLALAVATAASTVVFGSLRPEDGAAVRGARHA